MFKKSWLLIISILFLFSLSAFKLDNSNKIQVSGHGIIQFEPDTAYITAGSNGLYKNVGNGQKEINKKINQFIGKLGNIIPKEDVSTDRFNINNQYEYVSGKKQFMGYKIDQILRIKVSDLTLLGKIIDLAVASGMNAISNVEFTSSKIDEYKTASLKKALLNAKKKAEAIAQTMDIDKIKLKRISESGGQVQPLRRSGMQVKALASVESVDMKYQIGDMKVASDVNVVYEF